MKITIVVCDHCGVELGTVGGQYETYTIGKKGPFDICEPCQKKPFKSDVQPHPKAVALAEVIRLALRPEPKVPTA